VLKTGNDVTIVTYGMGVHWALEIESDFEGKLEIIDLRTLIPLDWETIKLSIKKTGKLLILHEDNLIGGIGGEISATISETRFQYLDAPIVRVASEDTPVPFSKNYE